MIGLEALIWLDTPIVPPPFGFAYESAWVRDDWLPPKGAPPPGGTPPTGPPGPPPNEALAVRPAGNVPLVAWPSVCTDHTAGAIISSASAPVRAIARKRSGP